MEVRLSCSQGASKGVMIESEEHAEKYGWRGSKKRSALICHSCLRGEELALSKSNHRSIAKNIGDILDAKQQDA